MVWNNAIKISYLQGPKWMDLNWHSSSNGLEQCNQDSSCRSQMKWLKLAFCFIVSITIFFFFSQPNKFHVRYVEGWICQADAELVMKWDLTKKEWCGLHWFLLGWLVLLFPFYYITILAGSSEQKKSIIWNGVTINPFNHRPCKMLFRLNH